MLKFTVEQDDELGKKKAEFEVADEIVMDELIMSVIRPMLAFLTYPEDLINDYIEEI
jgi:hypothetical protein